MLEIIRNKKIYRPVSRAAVIAIVLAALLAGTAVAAGVRSAILDRLYKNREPGEAAQSAIVRDADSASDAGLTLKLDEYLADTHSLNLNWSVTSQRDAPVYYVTWAEIEDNGLTELDERQSYVPGFPYGGASNDIGDGAIVQLTPAANRHSSYTDIGWTSGIDRPITARVTVLAYATELTPVQTDISHFDLSYAEPGSPAEARLKQLEADGQIGIAVDEPLCYVNRYAAYETALEALIAAGGDADEAETAALTESGLMRPLTALTVEVEIDPSGGGTLYALDGERTFELPGRTVVLKGLRFDMASTLLEYDVIFDGDPDVDNAWCWYLAEDPEGRVRNVDWSLSLNGAEPEIVTQGGRTRTVLHYTHGSDQPVTELPEALTFVPVSIAPRQEGESSQSYWQRVADLAAPEDCFTVELK